MIGNIFKNIEVVKFISYCSVKKQPKISKIPKRKREMMWNTKKIALRNCLVNCVHFVILYGIGS
jgi:hypothetical protein